MCGGGAVNPYARNAQQAALQRRNAVSAREAAYVVTTAACDAVGAHIKAHGSDGLATFCATYAGHSNTVKTAILGVVLYQCGRDARDEVREVLPLC